MSVLAISILVGLGAAGLTAIARAVVQDHGKVEWLMEKPLSCDLCMSYWCSLLLALIAVIVDGLALPGTLLVVPAGVGVSLLAIKGANRLSD